MVTLAARPKPLTLDLERTALIVVDIQNAFAKRGGMFDLAGYDISGAAPTIEVNRRILPAAREAGVKVIYLQMTYQADLSDGGGPLSPNYHKELGLLMMRDRPELRGKLLVEGTWDWQIVDELTPQPRDLVMKKSRYSGFCGTPLDSHLRASDIRYLLFTGIATNVCVESTSRDGFFRDYYIVFPSDLTATYDKADHEATLRNIDRFFGQVVTAHEVLACWAPAAVRAAAR